MRQKLIIIITLLLFNNAGYAAFPIEIIEDASFIVDPDRDFSWFGFFAGFLSFLFLPWSLIFLLWFPRANKGFKKSFWIGLGISASIVLILLILLIATVSGVDWNIPFLF